MSRRAVIGDAVRILAPRIPAFEYEAVLDHAVSSPGLRKAAPERAAWLSLTAYVRHALTDYDDLLDEGYDADSARHFVADEIDAVLEDWGSPRRLDRSAEAFGEAEA